jgi:hypothetical protein
MKDLKAKINKTVSTPEFLRQWQGPVDIKTRLAEIVFEILTEYWSGVDTRVLDNREIKNICFEIDELTYEINEIATPQINLQCWLFIGQTIEDWIDFALADEEFETAANLKKILKSEYV